MKFSQLMIVLILLLLHSTGCQKQNNFGLSGGIQVYLPNVIAFGSPENGTFYMQSLNPEVEFNIELMEIFDNYGNPIYSLKDFPPNDPSFGWDGTKEGELAESGTYSFSIRIGDGIGTLQYVGDFTFLH